MGVCVGVAIGTRKYVFTCIVKYIDAENMPYVVLVSFSPVHLQSLDTLAVRYAARAGTPLQDSLANDLQLLTALWYASSTTSLLGIPRCIVVWEFSQCTDNSLTKSQRPLDKSARIH